MTPKEKAEELIDKYLLLQIDYPYHDTAKQCALIAVDEILSILDYFNEQYHYYLEVKQEIEKL